MDFQQLANVVGQVGLPIGLIVWGVWFLSSKVWPWFTDADRRNLDREIEKAKSAALVSLGSAIEALAVALTKVTQAD
jgi:hypothetical protein